MLRRYLITLLLLAFVAPLAVSAKAVVERGKKDFLEDEFFTEPPVETSQEITEVVTQEVMDLEPVVDEPRAGDYGNLIDTLNFKKPNNYVSEWAAFWRLAAFNPKGNHPASSSVLNNIGLRYKVPDKWGEYYQLAYELSYNLWDGSNADVTQLEFAVEVFAAGSPVFRMKHHPYYGIGFGNAEIERPGRATYSANTYSVFGGIEFPGRRVDWDIFAKYIFAPVNDDNGNNFDMDDLQIGAGIVYTFGRGR